jgi:hypothetical protein
VARLQHNRSLLNSLVKSLEQRKAMIENLTKLHGQSYFASPKVSQEDVQRIEEERKRSARFKTHKVAEDK